MSLAQVGPLLFNQWVISNLAQKFSFVTNRFDSHDVFFAITGFKMMREASISTMLLLAGLSQAVSVAER